MKFPRIVRNRTTPATQQGKRARFDAAIDLARSDSKQFDVVKEGGQIIDYRDVTIRGYLSTFRGTTEADRDGDYVEDGAFVETIPKFMRNPVLLLNHRNAVESLAGSFTTVREDNRGLYVEAKLSNSPAAMMKDIRAKVAEGHLRTLSMGGIFHYRPDGRGIFKVDLYEGSLTPVPSNPDALISVREIPPGAMAGKWFRDTMAARA
jgi:HK97 family phage prohead protease